MALFGKKKKADSEAVTVSDVTLDSTPGSAPSAAATTAPTAPKLKVRPDVYTLLLGLSVAALLIAVVLLYLNIAAYGGNPLSGIPKV